MALPKWLLLQTPPNLDIELLKSELIEIRALHEDWKQEVKTEISKLNYRIDEIIIRNRPENPLTTHIK